MGPEPPNRRLTIETCERDLQQFSRNATAGSSSVEELSPVERRLRWDFMGRSGCTTSTVLRSGIVLSASAVHWERPFSVSVDQVYAPLKLVLLRGRGPRMTTSDGDDHTLHGGMFHVSRINRPLSLRFDFDEPRATAHHEELSVEIEPRKLAQLLGAAMLPAPIEHIVASTRAYPTVALPMGPPLFRAFDEIVACDARGTNRMLHLEGLGLSLIASLVDQIEESARAESPHISAHDRERLESARTILLARMQDPPTLPVLARAVGLNELKLKAGFRALFGHPVFAYLREQRMQQAWKLLREHRHTVTEVAMRVGYANPSKFAATFRKRFNIRPSDVS
jgi:AraC-like DNA-binding protein